MSPEDHNVSVIAHCVTQWNSPTWGINYSWIFCIFPSLHTFNSPLFSSRRWQLLTWGLVSLSLNIVTAHETKQKCSGYLHNSGSLEDGLNHAEINGPSWHSESGPVLTINKHPLPCENAHVCNYGAFVITMNLHWPFPLPISLECNNSRVQCPCYRNYMPDMWSKSSLDTHEHCVMREWGVGMMLQCYNVMSWCYDDVITWWVVRPDLETQRTAHSHLDIYHDGLGNYRNEFNIIVLFIITLILLL